MAVLFETLPSGPLLTNCYVIWDAATLAAAVIDPGGDPGEVEESVSRNGLQLRWVLLTHGHPDHVYAVKALASAHSARTALHADDVPQLAEHLEVGKMFYGIDEFPIFEPTDLLSDGQVIPLGESELRVLHTPGHSPGGVCLLTDAGVFCGDTVFEGSIGRTDLPGGSQEQLIASIRSKLLTLDDSTRLFPGHGSPTTVGRERRSNPYLQP